MAPTIELKSYQTNEGTKCALIKVNGPKWMQVLVMEGPLTIRRVPTSDIKFMTDITHKGKPYSMKKAIRIFRHFAKASGVTTKAKKFLKEANKSCT